MTIITRLWLIVTLHYELDEKSYGCKKPVLTVNCEIDGGDY